MRGAVILGILGIGALHHVVPISLIHWHNAFQHLYYLPIVLAGLSFGWRGGLWAAILAGFSNLPFNIQIWERVPNFAIDQLSEVLLFCAAGAFTGILGQRERRQRSELERTTKRLAEVCQELQDNFDSMKRAERLFALGQLSAGLAHEIRNPLASIAGAAGILERRLRAGGKEAECLTIISKECQRLGRLLSHFLEFARPRAPYYQSTDLVGIVDSVLALAAHAADGKNVVFRKELNPVGLVECDPELMKQVLLNLVINAVQAMPDGGEVRIAMTMRDSRVSIHVRDEGKGIDESDRDRIFDPFFTTKENGTGLGLSVAHQIIEQHGGILTAENNPVKGMTFSVQVPVRQARQHVA